MTLKDRVDQVFPEWQRWYPSLFDAPSTSASCVRASAIRRHCCCRTARRRPCRGELEHRRKWSADENEPEE